MSHFEISTEQIYNGHEETRRYKKYYEITDDEKSRDDTRRELLSATAVAWTRDRNIRV